ncbi:hypothetical protein Fmac_014549 [Flemingia macrophylla]|uniref:Uncharacterized protein n=1 Tax=Flemingia macrophylla TaxID=520843 RepID=A0ABD1MC19_9FABA
MHVKQLPYFFTTMLSLSMRQVVKNTRMLELVAKYGREFKPSSYHEIRTKFLKHQVEKTKLDLEEHKMI